MENIFSKAFPLISSPFDLRVIAFSLLAKDIAQNLNWLIPILKVSSSSCNNIKEGHTINSNVKSKSNATSKKYWPNRADPFFEHCATLKNRDVGRLPKNFFFCPSQNLTSQFLTHNGLKSPENFENLQTEVLFFTTFHPQAEPLQYPFISMGCNLNYLYKNTYTRSSFNANSLSVKFHQYEFWKKSKNIHLVRIYSTSANFTYYSLSANFRTKSIIGRTS